jgi:DNA-binding IclR family transcriptional regulator
MKINRSIDRSIKVLELVSQSARGLTLVEIQKLLEIPKSSAFDILQTLLAANMIMPNHFDSKRYVIGIKSFIIGNAYESDFIKVSRPFIKKLAQELGKTVFLGVEKEGKVTYIDKYEPKNTIITTAILGTRNPVYCTALGKAILSTYSKEEVIKILKNLKMDPLTKFTITDILKYIEDLKMVKERGYSIDNREMEERMLCVAAPIYDASGNVVGAISASGLYDSNENIDVHGKKVKTIARLISKALGYVN